MSIAIINRFFSSSLDMIRRIKIWLTQAQIKNIRFKANSALLIDSSFTELEKITNFLIDNPNIYIEIRGHTNGLCEENYCKSLSERRAKTVAQYFIDHKVGENRITFKGYGKSIPVADNMTSEGRSMNQRVELMITKVE
jgi:outer membrane protein OmpA-like peptidoglycan-associated protein